MSPLLGEKVQRRNSSGFFAFRQSVGYYQPLLQVFVTHPSTATSSLVCTIIITMSCCLKTLTAARIPNGVRIPLDLWVLHWIYAVRAAWSVFSVFIISVIAAKVTVVWHLLASPVRRPTYLPTLIDTHPRQARFSSSCNNKNCRHAQITQLAADTPAHKYACL